MVTLVVMMGKVLAMMTSKILTCHYIASKKMKTPRLGLPQHTVHHVLSHPHAQNQVLIQLGMNLHLRMTLSYLHALRQVLIQLGIHRT